MTKPNLDEKRDALAEAHANPQGVWDYADGQQVADFVAGWNAALEALRDVPGEFDSDACDRALEAKGYTETNSFFAGRYAARWQFERDKERIAAAENAARAINGQLGEALDRVAELTETIVFSLRGLQMWRKYQSPGNIAEVEQRLRQALKRDGGSDAQE